MKKRTAAMRFWAALLAVPFALASFTLAIAAPKKAVVGTWLVRQDGAPFPMHMYVFSDDGTVHQANPDAGNPRSSDSDGKGIWIMRGRKVIGKWVELSADRATHKYIGRGELSFELVLAGDKLIGTSSFVGFDADGKRITGPITVPFEGKRVTLP